jgi:hypothetical protein
LLVPNAMNSGRRVVIERCLTRELRMELDSRGRLLLAETANGVLRVDWASRTGRFSNAYGNSAWAAGGSQGDWSAGPWEYSNNTRCSLQGYVDDGLRMLREEVMKDAGGDVEALCRSWFAYGMAHGLRVESIDSDLVEFYISTISTRRPEELIEVARRIDREAATELWAKILERLEAFPPKQKRLIRRALGLVAAKPSAAKAK